MTSLNHALQNCKIIFFQALHCTSSHDHIKKCTFPKTTKLHNQTMIWLLFDSHYKHLKDANKIRILWMFLIKWKKWILHGETSSLHINYCTETANPNTCQPLPIFCTILQVNIWSWLFLCFLTGNQLMVVRKYFHVNKKSEVFQYSLNHLSFLYRSMKEKGFHVFDTLI